MKSTTIGVRVSEDQRKVIEARAKTLGTTAATYLRMVALQDIEKHVKKPKKTVPEVPREHSTWIFEGSKRLFMPTRLLINTDRPIPEHQLTDAERAQREAHNDGIPAPEGNTHAA